MTRPFTRHRIPYMSKAATTTKSGALRVRRVDPLVDQGNSTAPAIKSERVVVEGFRLGRLLPRDRSAFAKLLHKQRAQAKKGVKTTTI
jgi:hypothetical protein